MPSPNELELSEIKPSGRPEKVKAWNDDPQLLVTELRNALNQVTICLEPDETDSNRRAKLKDGVHWETRAVFLCGIYPTQLAGQIKLFKTLHPTIPFDDAVLFEVSEATQPFDSLRFVSAIIKWKTELEQLADWAEFQNRIRPQATVETKETGESNRENVRQKSSDFVTVAEVVSRLQNVRIETSSKRLNNHYKQAWGTHDSLRGNAFLFDWNRIRPIVEEQFSVRFDE